MPVTEKLYDLVLLFFVYAFLGWGCEVAFAACKQGRFVNRGFLNGPLCPIYGFGVTGVVLALMPVKDNLPLLYVGSVILTSAIEFITGFALEKLFHARWWDYSRMPLNIMGYVCILFSMIWGVACMAIVLWIHPLIASAVRLLPDWLCIALDAVFLLVFAVDLCATVSAVRKLSDRLKRLTELGEELHGISDEIGRTISDTTLTARERVIEGQETVQARRAMLEQGIHARRAGMQAQMEARQARIEGWLAGQREHATERTEAIRTRFEGVRTRMNQVLKERGFGHRRILNAFPNLVSHTNQEAVEALRAFYERHRRKG